MDEIRKDGSFVRKALMVALVLTMVISPFFYHLVSFLLLPVVIPFLIIFAFVYFTGLTDFEQRRMVILNIVFAVVVIVIYELYVFLVLTSPGSHADTHLTATIWLAQIIAFNFFVILYRAAKALRRRKELRLDEIARS